MSFVLTRSTDSDHHFQSLQIGAMKASIQASEYHYCSPRRTLASSDNYEAFEVALILQDEWFHPEKDARFAGCDWAQYWSEYDDVAARVPRAAIEQMLKDLSQHFGN